ncbi:MAG TPA: ABC transporter permease [Candidatus Baltobacteraceae bacterium]|jgi:oligopeptide transport system permease protein|nr:ABC transporter permease [Candidatus Baltobacteraceae bacterium]
MYFLRRIFFFVPLLLLISFLAFGLVHLMPGGPFDNERRPASPEIERHLRAKYHLDEPFLKQYLRYLNGILHGDFGPSMKYRNHSVSDIIMEGLPVSLTLGAMAFCFAMGAGIPLGFYTAVHKGQWQDYLGSFLALIVICVPGLVIGPILVMFFAVKLHWFPVALWGSPWRAILPILTLGLYFSGRVARLMREGMLGTLHSEFITTARAKGLSEAAILIKHAFRIAVLPVLSYSGPMLADLLTGSFIIENLFQLPGIGVFMVNSSLNSDYTMVVGLVLLYAVLLLALNLAVDFIHSRLDPRVRYE